MEIPLPTLARHKRINVAEIAAAIAVSGYALLHEYCPSLSSASALERLGVIETVEGLNTIQHLMPKDSSVAPPNTCNGCSPQYKGMTGTRHTRKRCGQLERSGGGY